MGRSGFPGGPPGLLSSRLASGLQQGKSGQGPESGLQRGPRRHTGLAIGPVCREDEGSRQSGAAGNRGLVTREKWDSTTGHLPSLVRA